MKRLVSIVMLAGLVAAVAAANGQGEAPNATYHAEILDGIAIEELSEAERDALLFMSEEEKVARDLYLAFADEYGLRVFENIARAEQQHIDSVVALLNRYEMELPATMDEPGVYSDPELQALYDDLLARGLESATAAIEVGVAVEETDIADLEEALAVTDNADIELVFSALLEGSRSHLAAFSGQADGAAYGIYGPGGPDGEFEPRGAVAGRGNPVGRGRGVGRR